MLTRALLGLEQLLPYLVVQIPLLLHPHHLPPRRRHQLQCRGTDYPLLAFSATKQQIAQDQPLGNKQLGLISPSSFSVCFLPRPHPVEIPWESDTKLRVVDL